MKKDINNRHDIEILVNNFYAKVKQDAIIGKFFTEVVKLDWNEHMVQMYDFWESILFNKSIFSGNPLKKHKELNQKSPLNIIHFEHWIKLFNNNVDELFCGENAIRIKQNAGIIKENLAARTLNTI